MKIIKCGLLVSSICFFSGCTVIKNGIFNDDAKKKDEIQFTRLCNENKGRIEWKKGDSNLICVLNNSLINLNQSGIQELLKINNSQYDENGFDKDGLTLKEVQKKRFTHYEDKYFTEYYDILKNSPTIRTTYIQPSNKKEPCKLMFKYVENNQWFKEESYKVFWDGECKNGFANGLGREIEKDTLMNKWGLAIYKDGKPTYYIINDILRNVLFEGISESNKEISYGVSMLVTEKMGDLDVRYKAISKNDKELILLVSETSPFWNGTYQFVKEYPNFDYVYINTEKNDESDMDYEFFLADKKSKNGWALGKPKNRSLITGEFVSNKFNKVDLPIEYKNKSDEIINEIKEAQQKAVESQAQAQLVKKQYLNKICKDKIKVSFMDNDDYKSICNNQKEKELYSKINDKLQRISKEKIAKLEQQRYNQQKIQQEQYKNQQLEIERQKLAAQQAQAQAMQKANLNQSLQNLNNNLNNSWNSTQSQLQNMQMNNLNNNLNNLNRNLNQLNGGSGWTPQW